MPRKKKVEKEAVVVEEEATIAERVEDPLVPQEGDTAAKAAYRKMLAAYKEQNPEKYEAKKERFLKKLSGDITMTAGHNPTGTIRTTFKVPDIQTKKK